MKNHVYVNDRLLQTNKTFSHLKASQKNKISEWMYEEYKRFCLENGRTPGKQHKDMIVQSIINRIKEADIWIPDEGIYRYYEGRKNRFQKRFEREQARISTITVIATATEYES